MPKFPIVIDISSDEDEVIDLVSSDSSIEASILGGLPSGGASSPSLSSLSPFLPSWICFPDGRWLQVNNIFDECDGLNEESQATSDWYAEQAMFHVGTWGATLYLEEFSHLFFRGILAI
jgi:hypothetical protein